MYCREGLYDVVGDRVIGIDPGAGKFAGSLVEVLERGEVLVGERQGKGRRGLGNRHVPESCGEHLSPTTSVIR